MINYIEEGRNVKREVIMIDIKGVVDKHLESPVHTIFGRDVNIA